MIIRCEVFDGCKYKRVEGYTIVELYNKLCSLELISMIDYDPYEKARCEKAGVDYDEFLEKYEDELCITDEMMKDFPDLTHEEIYQLIIDETERCKVYRWNQNEMEWISLEEDEENGIEWFDEDGKLKEDF